MEKMRIMDKKMLNEKEDSVAMLKVTFIYNKYSIYGENMEKGIIGIFLGKSTYGALDYFTMEIAQAFQDEGNEVVFINLDNIESANAELRYLDDKNVVGLFGFNGMGINIKLKSGEKLSSSLRAKYYGFFVDHTMYQSIRHNGNQSGNTVFFVDRKHTNYAKKYYKTYDNIFYLPHGGTLHEGIEKASSRKKDIVFLGSYQDPNTVVEQICKLDSETNKKIINAVIVTMIDGNLDVNDAFDVLIKNNNFTLSEEEYKYYVNMFRYADQYVRKYYRYLIIKLFLENKIHIDVYGNGWEKFKCSESERKYLHIYKPVEYLESLELMEKYKVVLNIMPWFKDGGHERVFNSMLAGAVCLTDTSEYLLEEFEDDKNIVFYSLHKLDELPNKIKKLLSNPMKMNSIADSGRMVCEDKHTWRHRALKILEIMEEK